METGVLKRSLVQAVNRLPSELRTVLVLHYGLGNGDRQSFDQISKTLNVRKNRLAELELKGIRQLRRPAICGPVFKVLESMETDIWHEIAEVKTSAGSLVPKSDVLRTLPDTLCGEVALALKWRYGSVLAWIGHFGTACERGWFHSPYPPETVKEKLDRLTAFWNENRPPFMLSHLAKEVEADIPFLLLLFSMGPLTVGFYGGYAAERPLPSFALRAIRLHLIAMYRYSHMPLDLENLISDYNQYYWDDRLNTPMAKTILGSASRIFRQTGEDGRWIALGTVEEQARFAGVDHLKMEGNDRDRFRNERPFIYERPWAETTASQILEEILDFQDLHDRKSIVESFLQRTKGHYQAISAETAFNTSENIVEVAPGRYGLSRYFKDIDPVHSWSEKLLTRKDCKRFLADRYAGEPLNTFLLWTPAMEKEWCFWAEWNSNLKRGSDYGAYSDRSFNRMLYQSLLYVCEPDMWPVPHDIITQWRFKKQAISRYHFADPVPRRLWQKLPSLQDLFMIGAISNRMGYCNWIIASTSMGLGRHSTHAAGAMALLIALDMIRSAAHWQKRHEIGPELDSSLSSMTREIRNKGFIHWKDKVGIQLKKRLRERISSAPLGWVKGIWIDEFLNILDGMPLDQAMEKASSNGAGETSIQKSAINQGPADSPGQLMLPF